jgi:hypothetical protein
MPKKTSTPVKASRKVAVEEDEEDEDEVVVTTSAKKTSTALPKSAKNGKATNGKVATTTKKVAAAKADEEEAGTYTPNANSMRDFVMRAMKRGGTVAEIKKRAARFAEKKGFTDLSEARAYKNFDVIFFAKFLKGKGYDVDIDEANDNYKLNV